MNGSRVVRSGYIFQMYLPDVVATAVPEGPTGGVGPIAPDASQSEVFWCCYAWPSARGSSGKRTFFVSQTSDVLATGNTAATQRYSGTMNPPLPTAAFLNGTAGAMSSTVAANATAIDNGIWVVVN
ncbi:MAG: hypothetical protein ACYTF5_17375 [Planctomycetota bacterium]